MANRVSELREIKTKFAIDKTEKYLITKIRKTGIGSINVEKARPLDEIGIQIIKQLQKLHSCLHSSPIDYDDFILFSSPKYNDPSIFIINSVSYRNNFNIICDYFESPLDSSGKRHYIRQHQLRRFFVLLFFHGNSFGKLNTLQIFLGHSDPEHLYNYITHNTPGSVLKGVKATFVAENLQQRETDYLELANLIEKKYRTSNFTICSTEELELIIEDLLDTNKIKIEPEYFTTESGKKYKIIVKIIS